MSEDDLKLVARKRNTGKIGARELADSDVRGVIYGKTQEPIAVTTNYNEFTKVHKYAGGNQIVSVVVEDEGDFDVLFKEMDFDPISNKVRHFDAYAITRGEKITVSVPIEVEDNSPAARAGLNVVVLMEAIEVSTLPRQIPEKFVLSAEKLAEIGDGLHVSDIAPTDGIEILDESQALIAKVEEIQEMQVEDDSPEVELPEGEEGKEGEEGEAGEEDEVPASGEADKASEKSDS